MSSSTPSTDLHELRSGVAVVTGAAHGLGRAFVLELASREIDVVVADIDGERAEQVAAEASAHGVSAVGAQMDVASAADVERLATMAFEQYGNVSSLFCNAGVISLDQVWDTKPGDWDRVVAINLTGVMHCLRVFMPRMIDSDHPGRIVMTSSMGGLISRMMTAPYCATKHGVIALAKALREELRTVGSPIGVSVVCPGSLSTDIMANNRRRSDFVEPVPGSAVEVQLAQMETRLAADHENAMTPEAAARVVFDDIQAGRFYSFPNGAARFPALREDILELLRDSGIDLNVAS